MSEIFTDIRITKIDKGTMKAVASCKVAGALFITGLRVIEGKNGLFVSCASRKLDSGEYKDIYFPASKEVREEMQEAILGAFYAQA